MSKHRRQRRAGPLATGRALPDTGDGASAFSLAQVSGEWHGLTLHTDTLLEQCRHLQDHARELQEQELERRSRERARRVKLLTVTALALWLSALIALISQQ